MDAPTQRIAEFVTGLGDADLPAAVVHECKRRIVDTIGCAVAAFDEEPARIARSLAMRVSVPGGASLIGTSHRTLPELAALANSIQSRFLEGNDTYPGGGGHPSDCLLPILGVAEASGVGARTAIAGIVLGYEVHAYLFRAFPMRRHALDYVVYTAVASAVGAARVLGLSTGQVRNAISLAMVPNLALDVTRRGHLSMWKGSAAPNAARNGVFAAYMAAAGMTGPATPIEGGLTKAIGEPQPASFPLDPSGFSILKADFKYFLSEYHAQGPSLAALELRPQVNLDDIESIEIFTYEFAWKEIGSGAEKWRPNTRETADHSMPYIVANVLIEGAYSDAMFSPERYADRRALDLMRKIKVTQDADFNRQYPSSFPCRMEIRLRNGERKVASVTKPIGHHDRPMSDEQVSAKFRGLAERKLAPKTVEGILRRLWRIDDESELASLFAALALDRAAS